MVPFNMHVKASAHSNLTYVHHAATCTCMRRSSYFSQSFFPESTTEYPPTVRHHRHHRRVVMTARLSVDTSAVAEERSQPRLCAVTVQFNRSIERTNDRSNERMENERTNSGRRLSLTHSLTYGGSGTPTSLTHAHSRSLTRSLPRANNE